MELLPIVLSFLSLNKIPLLIWVVLPVPLVNVIARDFPIKDPTTVRVDETVPVRAERDSIPSLFFSPRPGHLDNVRCIVGASVSDGQHFACVASRQTVGPITIDDGVKLLMRALGSVRFDRAGSIVCGAAIDLHYFACIH